MREWAVFQSLVVNANCCTVVVGFHSQSYVGCRINSRTSLKSCIIQESDVTWTLHYGVTYLLFIRPTTAKQIRINNRIWVMWSVPHKLMRLCPWKLPVSSSESTMARMTNSRKCPFVKSIWRFVLKNFTANLGDTISAWTMIDAFTFLWFYCCSRFDIDFLCKYVPSSLLIAILVSLCKCSCWSIRLPRFGLC